MTSTRSRPHDYRRSEDVTENPPVGVLSLEVTPVPNDRSGRVSSNVLATLRATWIESKDSPGPLVSRATEGE